MSTPRQALPYGFKIHLPEKSHDKPVYQFYVNAPEIRALVFKGGGSRIFVYCKFLEIAHQNGFLQRIKEVGGSSSGAVAAALAAIPFIDSDQRVKVFKTVFKNDPVDLMGDSDSWHVFRALSPVANIVSKPLGWAALFSETVAKQCKQLPSGFSKLASTSFSLLSTAFKGLSDLTSPRGIAGLYNFVTTRGIYRGVAMNRAVRDAIQTNVQVALQDLLDKITNQEEREVIVNRLASLDIPVANHF